MKWLSISGIKKHSRIDYDCEDALLELYGNAAEETVLNIMGYSGFEDFESVYGTDPSKVPAPIRQAALILVDTSYMQRTAVSTQNLYAVPYAFDFLIKPYMRLGYKEEEHVEPENPESNG